MKFTVLCTAAFAASATVAQDVTLQEAFRRHMALFHDSVAPTDEAYASRFAVFQANARLAQQRQVQEASGARHDRLDLNPFASDAPHDFAAQRLMPVKRVDAAYKQAFTLSTTAEDPPPSWDWREKGAVSVVKDQGTLGTCWAFSTAANIEGQDFLSGSKVLANYSVEQLVECDAHLNQTAGEADCGEFGGWPNMAFEYIIQAGGLRKWEDMPYCAGIDIGKPGSCAPCMAAGYNKTLCGNHGDLWCNKTSTLGQDEAHGWCSNTDKVAVKISGWHFVSEDEDDIAAELVSTGPLSILLNAGSLQFYHKGIADPMLCNPEDLDHAVLLVGYGSDNGTPYWIVKNSWGTKWGEEGYFRMVRGKGKCGLNRFVTTSEM